MMIMTSEPTDRPRTVSVRSLWPFLRVMHGFGPELDILRKRGIDPQKLSDSDERISRRLLGEVIWAAVRRTGDLALGVHAGEKVESADFGVMDLAARACPDMRRAMECVARYVRLQDDNVEMVLREDDHHVLWQLRNVVPPALRVTNDFQVTIAIVNLRRHLGRFERPIEVHLRHTSPTDAAEYERVFCAPVRYGMLHNGLVLPRMLLDQAIPSANAQAYGLFDLRASRMLEQLTRADTMTAKVRRVVTNRIGREKIGIVEVGDLLSVSEATLRRRLEEEGTTYRAVVDDLRKELAVRYVAERRMAIGEIAFLLGFSSQGAFSRAFRRWTGDAPIEHRLGRRLRTVYEGLDD